MLRTEPNTERTHVLNAKDNSPKHLTYPEGYDSRCNWCWLGYAHSEACHAADIAKKEQVR